LVERKTNLKKSAFVLVIITLVVNHFSTPQLLAADDKFGFGIKGGFNKLEGDWKEPRFNPMGSFVISYAPLPYFSIGAEVNTSILRTRENPITFLPGSLGPIDPNLYQTTALPMELDFRFNLSPFTTVNPFASIGFGGLMWDARYDNQTIQRDGVDQRGTALFMKTSGGLEFLFDNGLGLMIGADFRYTGFDMLDQNGNGDENDGIISLWAGLNYYITRKDPQDMDRDNVPKKYDLDLYQPEDRNGYMDHDGKPDYGKALKNSKSPLLIHYPVFRAEAGKDLKIKAIITSEKPIKTAAVIYRTIGTSKWKLVALKKGEDLTTYNAMIKGSQVTPAGLEYCVVAVDQDLKGIGYSGLPKRPIVVKVDKSGKNWRVVSGIAAFLGWGAAAYIVMRKQNIY
jgi:hypothetical protein